MKPSGELFIRPIGSNWSMIPLCREDSGEEIHVNIIPVYESFRNREVQFLVGARLSVFLDRLGQDWTQLLLSVMAILVDRKGAGDTGQEISAILWPDKVNEVKKHNYLRQLFFDLRQTLENVGVDSIVIQSNYSYTLDVEKIDCDYYAYLKTGKPEFCGEYMMQYSWAEETCGLLWERS